MSTLFKKAHFAMTRAARLIPAIFLVGAILTAARADAPKAIHLEAENGELVGTTVMKDGTGFSGDGYVGGFEAQKTAVRFHDVPAAAGIYDIRVRYRAPETKGIDFAVDGHQASAMLAPSGAGFATQNLGKVELKDGKNEISIERGWGYYQIDALDLTPAAPPSPLRRVTPRPVDAQATPEARRLLAFLAGGYGLRTLSGQHGLDDVAFVRETAGVSPAIVSSDLIEFSPSRVAHGANPGDWATPMIAQYKAGSVLSVMWHWNAPKDLLDKKFTNAQGREIDASWYRGFYTEATTFDFSKALADPKSEDYQLLLRDMDVIAAQLKKLQDAKIPVLWRPLHEAEGGWFWWGARGPEPFKKLWRLMYDRFTNVHGLHNLIWVYTSGGKKDWYPGDDVVDIIGADAYPSDATDPLVSIWTDLLGQHDGRKLVALTEYGGVPDIERARRFGVRWAYFASWGGNLGPKKVTAQELTRLYHEKTVANRDAIAAFKVLKKTPD